MIINFVIYGTIFIFSYIALIDFSGEITGANKPGAQPVSEFLHILILIAGFIILLLVSYLIFSVLGGIVTAPFNERISKKVEEIVAPEQKPAELGFWTDVRISLIGELQKLAFYFLILLLLFLLNILPVVGTVLSTSIGLVFSFFYNALDFMDYPLTRRLATFKRKVKVVKKGGMLTYGFGCMSFLLMFLPVVNVFMKPVLVVAGTSLFYEKKYSEF
jgi:CysZ protein